MNREHRYLKRVGTHKIQSVIPIIVNNIREKTVLTYLTNLVTMENKNYEKDRGSYIDRFILLLQSIYSVVANLFSKEVLIVVDGSFFPKNSIYIVVH